MKVAIQLTARKRIKVLGYKQQRRHTDSYSFCTFVFLPFCTLRQFASIPVIGFQLQSHRDYQAMYGLRVICFLWRNHLKWTTSIPQRYPLYTRTRSFFGYHASGHTLSLTLVYCSHSMVSYDTLSMLYLCTRTVYRFAETSV